MMFLALLPSVYVLSTSLLISFGLTIQIALFVIMSQSHSLTSKTKFCVTSIFCDFLIPKSLCNQPEGVRLVDRVHFGVNFVIVILNMISLVVTPRILQAQVDFLLLSNLWILMYYVIVCCTSLIRFPFLILSREDIRTERTHPKLL